MCILSRGLHVHGLRAHRYSRDFYDAMKLEALMIRAGSPVQLAKMLIEKRKRKDEERRQQQQQQQQQKLDGGGGRETAPAAPSAPNRRAHEECRQNIPPQEAPRV